MDSLLNQRLAAFLPRITAVMSWLGSLSITIDVVRKYRKASGNSASKPTVYHGLMLGMSLFDMSFSGALMLTTWPIPADTPGAYNALGNDATCSAQAFFMQLGIGAPFYNLCLSIYYYCFIVKNTKPTPFVEKCMHLVCVLFAFGTAIAAQAAGMFGYATLWCWITPEYNIFRYIFFHGPIWAIIICIFVIMSMIYYDLKKQEKRQRRWKLKFGQTVASSGGEESGGAANTNNGAGASDNQCSAAARSVLSRVTSLRRPKRQSNRLSDNVKWQAFCYVGSFIVTWTFLTIARAMETAGRESIPFWLLLAGSTLVPIQGFFNFLIYIRPRFKEHRKRHPEVGRMRTFVRVSPLFTGWGCCGGAPACCAGIGAGLGRSVQRVFINQGDMSNEAAPPSLEYNSQEKSDSEHSSAEEGLVRLEGSF